MFLDLGTGYTDAFSLFRFVNYICMICALFCLNVAPKKRAQNGKKNISRGFERFRETKHPKTCPWDGGLRKPLGYGMGRGVKVNGLQAECSRVLAKRHDKDLGELVIVLSL